MTCDHLNSLRLIRLEELSCAFTIIPAGSRLLEIGAGAGWQARALAEFGYKVEAIDVHGSRYAEHRVWPVTSYDGRRIPFQSSVFDAVFTSNTLEHVPHIEVLQDEIRRVLKPNGLAVHIVPTGFWRFWTSLMHYLFVVRTGVGVLGFASKSNDDALTARVRTTHSLGALLRKAAFPPRHGERGNSITELWTFSRWGWLRLFARTGWQVESYKPLRLFYTGYQICGAHLSLRVRRRLSKILGSATMVYIARPKPNVASHGEDRT